MNKINFELGLDIHPQNEEYLGDIYEDGDVSDNGEIANGLIENLTNEPTLDIPFDYIDGLVLDQDYLGYQDYLDSLSPALVEKVKEYIEFNHPEFMKEDDEILLDERFSKSDMRPDIAKTFNSRKGAKDDSPVDRKTFKKTNTDLRDVLTW